MAETTQFILGFDPGGEGRFGWAVCEIDGHRLSLVRTGVATHAQNALQRCMVTTGKNVDVLAAGIDAPLFWTETGNRVIDAIVRDALQGSGYPPGKVGGTVQHINSLRGACVAQGVLLGMQLRETYCGVRITETHPKALLYLLHYAQGGRHSDEARELDTLTSGLANEHERDATVSAFAAWSMYKQTSGWQDLYLKETRPIDIVGTPVHYFMPIP